MSGDYNNSAVQQKVVVYKYAAQQMAVFSVVMLPDVLFILSEIDVSC